MRAFTLKTNIVARDKASKQMDKITASSMRMTKSISRESRIAGRSFARFARSVNRATKRALVSINNFEARARRSFRRVSDSLLNFKNLAIIGGIGLILGSVIGTFAKFEQANATLASVMGKTVQETVLLQNDAKRLGATTARTATEIVGLQESFARLGFAEQDIINLTESTIAGSVAMQGELSQTAELVGAMINSFDAFETINAPDIIDQMTLATQKSALSFEKLQLGLPIVSGAANAAGVPFTKLLALMGKLADAGIDTSSSATALRNIFIDSAAQGLNYEQILDKIKNSQDKLTAANDEFGKRGAISSVVLAQNIDGIKELDKVLQNASGTAGTTAAKQLDTLTGSLTILGSAWEGFILSLEDGTGSFGTFLKTSVRVVTDMLSLATGTAITSDKLTEQQQRIRNIATTMLTLIKVVGVLTAILAVFKVVMIAVNFVMAANPISLIVLGIVALIATIVLMITHWDEVKAAVGRFFDTIRANPFLKFLFLPILLIIDAVKFLIANFDTIKASIMNFWKIIKESPITEFLLKPIMLVIDSFKLLIKGIKKVAEFFGPSEGIKLTKSETKDVKITRLPTEITKKADTDTKLIESLNKNTTELDKNTNSTKAQWKGKFFTSILKDANVTDRTISREIKNTTIQKELAMSVVDNEVKNSAIQNEIITNTESTLPTNVVTKANSQGRRNNNQVSGNININVVDKTGGNFALEVESTGVDTTTTGNA